MPIAVMTGPVSEPRILYLSSICYETETLDIVSMDPNLEFDSFVDNVLSTKVTNILSLLASVFVECQRIRYVTRTKAV